MNLFSDKFRSLLKWNAVIWIPFLLLHVLFSYDAMITERLYFEKLYQGIRLLYDHTLGNFPFPMVYIAIPLLLFWVIRVIIKIVLFPKRPISAFVIHGLLRFSLLLGSILVFFYLSWGYNYKRPSFPDNYHLPKIEMDSNDVYTEALNINKALNRLRKEVAMDADSMTTSYLPKGIEATLRNSLTSIITDLGSPASGRGRVRDLYPEGILLRVSTAGIYMPFAFEGQVDHGLHPLQKPFVMAHEMGHVYGYAEEGTCNFLGFLACMNHEDKFVQYSGLLGYWRYLASNLRRTAPEKYKALRAELSPAVKNDLNAIADQMDKFPDILPELRDQVYHTYLKTNGIKDGIDNYSVIVQLVARWKVSDFHRDLYDKIYAE